MNQSTPLLLLVACALAILSNPSPLQANVLVSDFNNTGFEIYPGPPANWEAAATEGPEYLSIVNPDQGIGTAGYSTFLTPLPDFTGTTSFQFELRLGPGNQVDDFLFRVTAIGGSANWNFTSSDLSSTEFTTLVFFLDDPSSTSGAGIVDALDQVTTITFSSPNFANQNLNLQMDFGNLVAVVPEPASGSLLAATGFLFLLKRRAKA